MHVYTLVWLKSDRIRFLIVGLKRLDYMIVSPVTPACIHSIRSDRIGFYVLRRLESFFPGPWAGIIRTAVAASFLWNNRTQERHCASSLCNYHVHHIRWSFLNAEAEFVVAGDIKRSARGGSITTSLNGYSATYRAGVWHALANNSIFSLARILGQLQLSDWAA